MNQSAGLEAKIHLTPQLRNGLKLVTLISDLETVVAQFYDELADTAAQFRVEFKTALAVLKDQVDLIMLGANGTAPDEMSDLRKQSRVRELGLRLRAGDPQAGRSMLQRQRALKAVEKMRAVGFPNLLAARAAKVAKAAEKAAGAVESD